MRVDVNPEILTWASERSGRDETEITRRFPHWEDWKTSKVQPTFKQLEAYAKMTRTPVGYFFLKAPPEEHIPIPDFRTMGDHPVHHPRPNLLDTIYLCQQRQNWYREYALTTQLDRLRFPGSVSQSDPIDRVARDMREMLGFEVDRRARLRTWEEALREFIAQADEAGVLVMCSGIVGNNTRRKLDPEEFRGFALADDLAPVVFINGADTKSAQMFTLAHELAHLWLGQSALSSAEIAGDEENRIEQWCNAVAAEFLVPRHLLKAEVRAGESTDMAKARLAKRFKVSTLVILRRLNDIDFLSRDEFWNRFTDELNRLVELRRTGTGGNFYPSQAARVSKRFARALISSAQEGQTLYRDAMHMLGVRKMSTFNELGRSLGIVM